MMNYSENLMKVYNQDTITEENRNLAFRIICMLIDMWECISNISFDVHRDFVNVDFNDLLIIVNEIFGKGKKIMNKRKRVAIIRFYGLDGGEPKSYKEIADELQIKTSHPEFSVEIHLIRHGFFAILHCYKKKLWSVLNREAYLKWKEESLKKQLHRIELLQSSSDNLEDYEISEDILKVLKNHQYEKVSDVRKLKRFYDFMAIPGLSVENIEEVINKLGLIVIDERPAISEMSALKEKIKHKDFADNETTPVKLRIEV